MTRAISRMKTNCYLLSDKYLIGDNENVTYYVTLSFGELRARVERRGR